MTEAYQPIKKDGGGHSSMVNLAELMNSWHIQQQTKYNQSMPDL